MAITVRKIGAQTAHQSEQNGTWGGLPLFERTLCGRPIKIGEWAEIAPANLTGPHRIVGHGPSFLLQPCTRCEAKR